MIFVQMKKEKGELEEVRGLNYFLLRKMIKLTKIEKDMIKEQREVLKQRIEREHSNIPHSDMCGILSKVTDRFNIMLEEIFA